MMAMKHYKDSNNNLHGFPDDGSQDHLIGNKILLSNKEYQELQELKRQEFIANLSPEEKMVLEMPSHQAQMEALLTGGQAVADMLAKIKAIKAKYPKPEGF